MWSRIFLKRRYLHTPLIKFRHGVKPSTIQTDPDDLSFLTSSPAFLLSLEKQLAEKEPVLPEWRDFLLSRRPKKTASIEDLVDESSITEHLKVALLVRAYQARGHLRANLDPLGITQPERDWCPAPELDPEYYGLDEKNMRKEFRLGPGMLAPWQKERPVMTLDEILRILKDAYCGSIGFEYTHVPERDRCDWLRARIEAPTRSSKSSEKRSLLLERLTRAELFEKFISSKFPAEKRFGLEGGEALIPGLLGLIDKAVDEYGISDVILGMSHRGRLNVLANVIGKPIEVILSEFRGIGEPMEAGPLTGDTITGDVKYHLGMDGSRRTPAGNNVNLSLVANPSHLEAVAPVVQGKTRGLQLQQGRNVLPLILHGDAAFAGQGVVYETLNLARLPNYSTSGTIHLIVNNQIGFTTDPRFARSTPYCSDVAKATSAPILHVNGDDAEAVLRACELAIEWRHAFASDIVIDMVCYRKHGHNEVDQPSFTQPRMYQAIAKHPSVLTIFKERNEIKSDEYERLVWKELEDAYNKRIEKNGINGNSKPLKPKPTGFQQTKLTEILNKISTVPTGFNIHPALARILKNRMDVFAKDGTIDMPTAEALAFATLLVEEKHVRLSGQDVERGTFSQRHSVWHDQLVDGLRYVPLQHLSEDQAPFTVCNSSLSEYGILGFELGYSLASSDWLVLWEAQFGDFANGAQPMIDQFIAGGERKWGQRSGLVMLLPHGYDGAGPEHSNGHPERFLSLCDDDPRVFKSEFNNAGAQLASCNMQVVYPSTPASLFHVLRRQLQVRKPLILFTSKSLLRHPMARSHISELDKNEFAPFIPHDSNKDAKRIVLCCGQHYYALKAALKDRKDIALARLEQISPFPYKEVSAFLRQHKLAQEIVWAQEEAMNVGPWDYVRTRIALLDDRPIRYAGRRPSAAIATGFKSRHDRELKEIITEATK